MRIDGDGSMRVRSLCRDCCCGGGGGGPLRGTERRGNHATRRSSSPSWRKGVGSISCDVETWDEREEWGEWAEESMMR